MIEILVGLVAMLSMILVFVWPMAGLSIFLACIPFTEHLPKLPLFGTVTTAFGFLTFLSYAVHFFAGMKPLRKWHPRTVFWAFGLFISIAFSTLFSEARDVSMFMTFAQLFILFIMISQLIQTRLQVHAIMTIWIGAISLLQILGLLHYNISQVGRNNRFAGFTDNANILAYYSVISAWFVLYFFLKAKRFGTRSMLIGILSLNVVSVIFSVSRTGILTLGLSAAFAIFLMWKQVSKRLHWLGIAACALTGLLSRFNLTAVTQEVRFLPNIMSGHHAYGSWTDRLGLWKQWLGIWWHSPVFGVGIGASGTGEVLYINVAHNSFISILVEVGILGLIFFMGLTINSFRNMYKCPDAVTGSKGIPLSRIWLIVYFVWIVFSITNSQQYDKFFWIILPMAIILQRLYAVPAPKRKPLCAASPVSRAVKR